jgi:alpha-1,3-mannosyltransferase
MHSIALSIKMNILLTFPALLYILFINLGILKTLFHVFLIVLIQISFAVRFLSHSSEYLNNAFNFSRAFDWTWTVNWRWVGQETFSSEVFSRSLLGLHATGLIILLLLWSHKEGGIFKLIGRGLRRPQSGAALGSVRSSNNRTPLYHPHPLN